MAATGDAAPTFVYDGDGNRVKGTVGATTTVYIGNYFEWTGSTGSMKKYYYQGSFRVAMRIGTNSPQYLLSDHLGSTEFTLSSSGTKQAELRYKAWGENRFSSGSTPTTFRYTGQREESSIGLDFYNARWYDSALGRFISADTVTPVQSQGVQAYDRYAYANNSPVVHNDPSGHDVGCAGYDASYCYNGKNNPIIPTAPYRATVAPQYWQTPNFNPGSTPTPGYRIVAGPTSTPTPETEINTPQQPGFKLPTVKVKINWDEVDKVNIGIDVGGIVGDALLGVPSPVNAIGYGISEAAEFSGFVKSGIELFQGKPKDMIYWQLSKTAVEGLRLWPGVGTLFDIIDIGMNISIRSVS